MMLYFASKYLRLPYGQQNRMESIGFAGLTAAISVCRDMSEVAESGVIWVVTVRHNGEHFPAIVGAGGGAAIALGEGRYDLQPNDLLQPRPAA